MSTPSAGGKLNFEFTFGKPARAHRSAPDEPFRLAVLGDFSGRANRVVVEPIGPKRFIRVDIDNLEEVFGKLGAALKLPLGAETLDLSFESLEDFHPDRLGERVKPLSALLRLRKKALAGGSISEVSRELASLSGSPTDLEPATPQAESSDQTLSRLMGAAPASPTPPASSQPASAIDQLLRAAVAGSAVPGSSAEREAAVSAIDLELTRWLRAILHHPGFQALEATWRGLDLLVRRFGGEENVKFFMVDMAQHELAADLAAAERVESTGFYKLMRAMVEEQPLALSLGLYEFGTDLADLHVLQGAARVSSLLGVPLLAAAGSAIAGCDSFATHPDPDDWKRPLPVEFLQAWIEFRKSAEAMYTALSLPRFLLRQPYGKQGDPIESFSFEEMSADPAHEDYLWGNPAIACACVITDLFQQDGWGMSVGGWGEVGELPVHRFVGDGEPQVKPCAEAWLSDRAGETLLRKGMVPVLSVRGRDAVRVGYLQSIHEPAGALAGPFGERTLPN